MAETRHAGGVGSDHTLRCFAIKSECRACPLKTKCRPKTPSRKVTRDVHEDARDVARVLPVTEAFEQSRHDRKRVEILFTNLKRILRLGRLGLRRPRGAQDEFTLAAIAQNLRRLAELAAQPPPIAAACVA
jgi:aminoglycoside phosphotransferase (APT) family kinase protein